MVDGNELTKAIFIMAASPITPSKVRSFLVHSEDEPPEEKVQLLEEAVRVLPPGTFERYAKSRGPRSLLDSRRLSCSASDPAAWPLNAAARLRQGGWTQPGLTRTHRGNRGKSAATLKKYSMVRAGSGGLYDSLAPNLPAFTPVSRPRSPCR